MKGSVDGLWGPSNQWSILSNGVAGQSAWPATDLAAPKAKSHARYLRGLTYRAHHPGGGYPTTNAIVEKDQ